MRTLIMVLMIVGLMSTVGVYAASVTGTTATVGGTGDMTISSPTSSVDVDWTFDASNDVSGGIVNWTTGAAGSHTVKVTVGSSSASNTYTVLLSEVRTDAFTLSASVAANTISTAEVLIYAN